MVLTPEVGDDFIQWRPPSGDDSTLGVVDFSICPHVNGEGKPGNTMAEAEAWAAGISGPAYVVDDETAIRVVDGVVDVVSEGSGRCSDDMVVVVASGVAVALRRVALLAGAGAPVHRAVPAQLVVGGVGQRRGDRELCFRRHQRVAVGRGAERRCRRRSGPRAWRAGRIPCSSVLTRPSARRHHRQGPAGASAGGAGRGVAGWS